MLMPTLVSALALLSPDGPPANPPAPVPAKVEEAWSLSLRDAIRIGLENSEIVRVVPIGTQVLQIGAQAIRVTGFEPTPIDADALNQEVAVCLAPGCSSRPPLEGCLAGARVAGAPSPGTLPMVHDPAVHNSRVELAPTALRLQSDAKANCAPIVIARLNADASIWNFKAAVMAHVRSIEQQYWALVQQRAQVSSRETAVKLCEEIVRRERAELEAVRGTTADIAEAQQNLERFQDSLKTAKADLVTTERQLRNILGLPADDARRIVPITAPTEARVDPDWDSCLAAMRAEQPDIVQQESLVRLGEIQLILARNQIVPQLDPNASYQLNGLGQGSAKLIDAIRTPAPATDARARVPEGYQVGTVHLVPIGARTGLANTRAAQYQLLRQQAFRQQVLHQTTHSLARFFLEVDANHKQFQASRRLREAARTRLETTRACYEEGRTGFTIDRLLDAIGQQADAIGQEAQYRSSYNSSLTCLEEAKGTLLAFDDIVVLESCSPKAQEDERRMIASAGHTTATTVRFENKAPVADPAARPASHVTAPAPVPTKPSEAAKCEEWSLTLPEAIRIGLENSKAIKIVSGKHDTGLIRVAAAEESSGTYAKLCSEITAHIRSIEQQYWAFWQGQVALKAREKAVKFFEDIVRQEKAEQLEVSRGTTADLAEAQQNLERSQLAYISATADVITMERQLRNILGMPATGNRRIVATTPPTKDKVDHAWDDCVAEMHAHQPEILGQGAAVDAAEWKARAAREVIAVLGEDPAGAAEAEKAFAADLDRQRDLYDETVRKSTATLTRSFHQVDDCYHQAQAATKLREAAEVRLAGSQSFYNEGRTGFTIDRLLDAVSQSAHASAEEARLWATYNTAIASLGECRGTLLADRSIAVVRPARDASETKAEVAASRPKDKDTRVEPTLLKNLTNGVLGVDFDLDFNVRPTWHARPKPADTKPAAPAGVTPVPGPLPSPAPGAKTIRYQFAIDGWAQPIQIQGSISIGPDSRKAP
jgi:outer membrane protein TolC